MKNAANPILTDTLFRQRIIFISLALILLVFGRISQYEYKPDKWMTYRNFDVPGQKNFINYLSPGVKDVSSKMKYSFTEKHYLLFLGVIFLFFPFMLFLRIVLDRDFKLKVYRYLTQWLSFVIARLGILRVTGICPVKRTGLGVFFYINCQSCELATGACPLGTFQMSLLHKQIPLALIGQLLLTGIISGRLVCGWLCPYGFLSDIFDKLPGKRMKPPHKIIYFKYAVFFVFLSSSLIYLFKDRTDSLFYCSFICPAGFYYGVLEYAFTTGLHALLEDMPFVHFMLVYHFIIAILVIVGSIKLGGRFYCKYACPLGTIYGLFNRIALIRMSLNRNKCINCRLCEKMCPMQISVRANDHCSQSSCILCGRCKNVCPTDKIQFSINMFRKNSFAKEDFKQKKYKAVK